MKKKFFIVVISSMLLSGCSNSKFAGGGTEIPDTLIVDAELPQDVPSEVSIYKVSHKNFDSDELLELFDMLPVSSSGRDAIGQRYESGNSLLYVYDDEGVLNGGFSYMKEIGNDASILISNYCNTDRIDDKSSDAAYGEETLSFLDEIGLEELKVDRAYEFSGEELIGFLKSSDIFVGSEEITENLNINPEDTYFGVFLLQYIDDIPLSEILWDYKSGEQTYTTAQAIIFENKMIESRFIRLYDVAQEIRKDKIISPEAALDVFVDDYNKKLELTTTTITDISFRYVVTRDKDGMYAQPAYIIQYEYLAESANLPEPKLTKETKVISARTGEFILSAEVGI